MPKKNKQPDEVVIHHIMKNGEELTQAEFKERYCDHPVDYEKNKKMYDGIANLLYEMNARREREAKAT